MYNTLDISSSGLVAQRTRLEVVAANLANQHSLTNADGEYEPYRRRIATIAAGDPASGAAGGVHVESIEEDGAPLNMRFEPWSKYADAEGYVGYPNVNPVIEQMNAMEATRSYEANISVIEATKSMVSVALRIVA